MIKNYFGKFWWILRFKNYLSKFQMKEEKQGIPMGINKLAVIASTNGEVSRLLKHTEKYYMPPLSYSDAVFVHDVITGILKVNMIIFLINL